MKSVVQCDFDGTITIGEVSRFLLEEFADGDWLKYEKSYKSGEISVQSCNIVQFAMVKTDRESMTDFLLHSGKVEIRPGFSELYDFCMKNGFDFVITSNGLRFYIETILRNMGIDNIEIYAANGEFSPDGMVMKYPGPDGCHLPEGFKETYAGILKERHYDAIYYVGNGVSDIYPARHADHVFAIDGLLQQCKLEGLECRPFNDLFDVLNGIREILRES